MSRSDTLNSLRLLPRDSGFLNRTVGRNGDIYFDRDSGTIRIFTGSLTGGISLAKDDLSNVSNADFLTKATAAGISSSGGNFEFSFAADDSTIRNISSGNVIQFVGGSGITTASTADGVLEISNSAANFSTIAVTDHDDVVASIPADTVTLVAGSNVSIVSNANSKTITISSVGGGGGGGSNSFTNIAVSGQTTLEADSLTDTLTLVAGTGISITTNSGNDSITITNSSTPITSLSSLTDTTAASLTVDKFYLPAITKLTVTNSGASAYRFDQYGTIDNPNVYAINGTTIAFSLEATGHPFLIQTPTGVNYDTGLVHVSTTGVVSTGSSAQGKSSGTLYWKIPTAISGNYRYQCGVHAPMVGIIVIKSISTI